MLGSDRAVLNRSVSLQYMVWSLPCHGSNPIRLRDFPVQAGLCTPLLSKIHSASQPETAR